MTIKDFIVNSNGRKPGDIPINVNLFPTTSPGSAIGLLTLSKLPVIKPLTTGTNRAIVADANILAYDTRFVIYYSYQEAIAFSFTDDFCVRESYWIRRLGRRQAEHVPAILAHVNETRRLFKAPLVSLANADLLSMNDAIFTTSIQQLLVNTGYVPGVTNTPMVAIYDGNTETRRTAELAVLDVDFRNGVLREEDITPQQPKSRRLRL